jgi:hypothetical protein
VTCKGMTAPGVRCDASGRDPPGGA